MSGVQPFLSTLQSNFCFGCDHHNAERDIFLCLVFNPGYYKFLHVSNSFYSHCFQWSRSFNSFHPSVLVLQDGSYGGMGHNWWWAITISSTANMWVINCAMTLGLLWSHWAVGIFQVHHNLIGPQSYMQPLFDPKCTYVVHDHIATSEKLKLALSQVIWGVKITEGGFPLVLAWSKKNKIAWVVGFTFHYPLQFFSKCFFF